MFFAKLLSFHSKDSTWYIRSEKLRTQKRTEGRQTLNQGTVIIY